MHDALYGDECGLLVRCGLHALKRTQVGRISEAAMQRGTPAKRGLCVGADSQPEEQSQSKCQARALLYRVLCSSLKLRETPCTV